MADKFCQFCGAQMEPGAVVCPNCNRRMQETVFCKYCGEAIDKDAVICPKCGKQVGQLRTESAPQAQQPQIVINNANTNTNTNTSGMGYPNKSKMVALLLCLFLGNLGAHRFYVGKFGTGLIWLFTLGLMGIGTLVDLVMIIIGSFKDKMGMPLV